MENAPLLSIPKYEITQKLGEGPLSLVFKGHSKGSPERPLVIKVLKAKAVSEGRRNYFRQKIEHLKVLDDPRLITPLSFEEYGPIQIIVRDFFPGTPLDQWLRTQPSLPIAAFLEIACKLADALDVIHRAGVIHGGIKPHNILIQPRSGEIRIVDFLTPLDVRNISHFIFEREFVEGTLAYTSPEQTGRISYRVDFTTDLYSVGIVFYEMLARRLPFFSIDPLELIHSHLAEEAPSLHEINPKIPPVLSKIVAKLILKQPEKRYQSASGLYADLLRCQEEFIERGTMHDFPLGTRDRTHRVTFVSKMVGRERESRVILAEYDKAASGSFRSAFISGYSGIGKTRLIQELQRPIVKSRGYFAFGKFDVYQKNIPYSSMIQAFRGLMKTFLTESDERVAMWRRRILDAVGTRGRVVTEVIPELEILIGMQPPVPALPPIEARNRFHDVFGRFLGCLASEEGPLVLFIDDLQWCDTASFDFLGNVFSDYGEHPYLFLLGAYRHNEVDESHPLTKLIRAVPPERHILREIRLETLGPEHTHEMVSYILDSSLEATKSLAGFVYGLTEGNPLFVSESLSYLYNENLLSFDEQGREWRWNLERIRESEMPSSVVTLFSAKVRKLPPDTVALLEYCACMGNLFSPEHISRAREITILETFETLKPALSQGLLTENKEQLQFVHDKIQEATLSAIPPERRRRIHSEIGAHLLSLLPPNVDLEKVENLFTIASHLNLGIDRERPLPKTTAHELADINYHAGNKALESLATDAANEYFRRSVELLPEDSWETRYERTFSVYRKLAKTELMVGKYESSEKLLNQLLLRARSDLDKAEALAEQTTSLSSFGNFIKAIETANRGLSYFGKSLPEDPELAERKRDSIMEEIDRRYPDVWTTILNMPFTQDRKNKIELAFYSELIPDLYMSGIVPQLYLSAVQSTQHCLSGGMDESVIYSFSIMGLYLGEQERFEQAFRYEDLAKNLSERHPNTFGATRGINGVVWCNMHSRSRPEEIVNYCLKGIQSGKNCGDLYNAGLCYGPLMWNLQVRGADFGGIEDYARECLQFSTKFQLSFSVGLAEAMMAGWIEPMKRGYAPVPMDERIARWRQANHIASIGSYYVHRGLSCYYFREHESAEGHLQEVNSYLHGLTDNVLKRQWYVFRALNAVDLHEKGSAYSTREELFEYIQPILRKVEAWARLGPLLRPYLGFLYARLGELQGSFASTRALYLEAIDAAREEGYAFLEGHVHERMAEFLSRSGKRTAEIHLREALRLYRTCGAERAELWLLERYPTLEPSVRGVPGEEARPEFPSLDVYYLMKSAMLISAEIDTLELQSKIMRVVLESSGAQHGYLFMDESGDLVLRSEAHIGDKGPKATEPRKLNDTPEVCKAIVRYVYRTRSPVVLDDASESGPYKNDPEVQALQLRSVFCLPLVEQARTIGVLYLENRLADAVFTGSRTEMARLLASQGVISLEKARLVENLMNAEEQIKGSLREKEVLLREIHHRVKNNLQVISSLIRLQSRKIKDQEALALFQESENRVRSMAFIHEKLHQSEDMARIDLSGYIRTLTSNLFRSFGVDPETVSLKADIPPITVSIETAVPLGLIINELTSNALKHAFPGKRKGQISISVRANGRFKLVFHDTGVGFPEGVDLHQVKTLGLQLIVTLVNQLDGTVEVAQKEGTEFRISWPRYKERPKAA